MDKITIIKITVLSKNLKKGSAKVKLGSAKVILGSAKIKYHQSIKIH